MAGFVAFCLVSPLVGLIVIDLELSTDLIPILSVVMAAALAVFVYLPAKSGRS